MNFFEYIKWLIVYRYRTCDTCMGSNGNCDKCDEFEKSLYKRDWYRWNKSNWSLEKKFIQQKRTKE